MAEQQEEGLLEVSRQKVCAMCDGVQTERTAFFGADRAVPSMSIPRRTVCCVVLQRQGVSPNIGPCMFASPPSSVDRYSYRL